MEFEKGKWYKLKTAYDWYAKFKCFIGDKWVYEEKISIPRGQYEKQTHEGGWDNFKNLGYSGTLLTDLSEIQKYLPKNHPDLIKKYDHEVVHCTTDEELDYACKILKQDKAFRTAPYCVHIDCNGFDKVEVCKEEPSSYKIYSFEEWCTNNGYVMPIAKLLSQISHIKNLSELEKWLNETKAMNLTLDDLVTRITLETTCPYKGVYQRLEGATSKEKAKILFEEWKSESSPEVNPEYVEYTNSKGWFKSTDTLKCVIGKIYKWKDLWDGTIARLNDDYWKYWTTEFKPSTKKAYDRQRAGIINYDIQEGKVFYKTSYNGSIIPYDANPNFYDGSILKLGTTGSCDNNSISWADLIMPHGILKRGKTCVLELGTNNLLEFSFKPDNYLIFNSKKNSKFVIQVGELQEPIIFKTNKKQFKLI